MHAAALNDTADPHPDLTRIPRVVLDGLETLRHGMLDETEKAWLNGATFTDSSITTTLRKYKARDGEYQGFDLITVQDLTPRIRVLYLVLNYEHTPHILKFVAYHTHNGWILLQLHMDLDEAAIETALTMRGSMTAPQ